VGLSQYRLKQQSRLKINEEIYVKFLSRRFRTSQRKFSKNKRIQVHHEQISSKEKKNSMKISRQ